MGEEEWGECATAEMPRGIKKKTTQKNIKSIKKVDVEKHTTNVRESFVGWLALVIKFNLISFYASFDMFMLSYKFLVSLLISSARSSS